MLIIFLICLHLSRIQVDCSTQLVCISDIYLSIDEYKRHLGNMLPLSIISECFAIFSLQHLYLFCSIVTLGKMLQQFIPGVESFSTLFAWKREADDGMFCFDVLDD